MYHKANVFNDTKTAAKIMKTKDPKEQKTLGRNVRGFDPEVWDEHKEKVVEEGNWYKLTNSKRGPEIARKLLDTGSRELVEVGEESNFDY